MQRSVRLMALVICLMQVVGCSMWPEHANVSQFSEATGGEALEHSFWESVRQKDWKELDKHIAENYIAVTPRGRLNREEALTQLKTMQLQNYSISELTTNLNGETIVVSCNLALQGTADGQSLSGQPVHLLAVWQHQKAGWMLLAHSAVQ